MASSNDKLLQPFMLNKLTLKNRVFSSAHEPSFTEDGMPAERYFAYHEEKAKGGMAMSMIGGSTVVSRDSPSTFGNVDASTDRIIPHYKKLSDMLHSYDCKVVTHLTHLGRRTSWTDPDWLPLMSASCAREMAHKQFPKAVEHEDIDRIIGDYVAAALRAQEGGLDGVEIPVYSQFAGSFLIPNQNFRDDEYGGSLEGRMRFSLRLLSEIRAAVGDDYVVGIRATGGDPDPDGVSEEEAIEILKRYDDTGLLDYVSIVYGSNTGSEVGVSRSVPAMGGPASPHIAKLKELRPQISLPVIHSCRIMELGSARHAIESGAVDLVGMVRAHMADPHIIAKTLRGDEHRIRPCVGAGHCIDQIYHSGGAYCLHNPATGREQTIPQIVEKGDGPAKVIVIVGAGPAGMEAARVCAERGHRVKLFEASSAAGGQILIAAKAPRRGDLIGVVDWLKSELVELGVNIQYDRYMDASDITAENPDIVIMATGGIPNTEFMASGSEHVISTWDVLNGQANLSGDIIVYDENGAEPGVSCAEFLVDQGKSVEMVTPDRVIGTHIGGTNYPPMMKKFYNAGMAMTVDLKLNKVSKRGDKVVAHLWNELSNTFHEKEADHLIVEYGTLPADDVYFDLKGGSRNRGQIDLEALVKRAPQKITHNSNGPYMLFRIGDAVASRNVHAAMYEARRLCMVI